MVATLVMMMLRSSKTSLTRSTGRTRCAAVVVFMTTVVMWRALLKASLRTLLAGTAVLLLGSEWLLLMLLWHGLLMVLLVHLLLDLVLEFV
jgi:hypothetical protein